MLASPHVLDLVREALHRAYGQRLVRVVLFGSRARGDAQDDSDYDIAEFLSDIESRWAEFEKLAEVELDILYGTGQSVHAMPYRAGHLNDPGSPLMYEIRRDGIDL